jgi:Na+/H+ antiporter NhaD/arsenite permease-like protein
VNLSLSVVFAVLVFIAGNLMILGAAGNVIILQKVEGRAGESISLLQSARAGIPLTLVHPGVHWLFLRFT